VGGLRDLIGGRKGREDEQAVGAFAKSEQFRNMSTRLLSSNQEEAQAAIKQLSTDLASSNETGAVRDAKQGMMDAAQYAQEMIKNPAGAAEWAKGKGLNVDVLKQTLGSMYDITSERQRTDRAEAQRRRKAVAGKEGRILAGLGVYDATTGALTADTSKLSKQGQDLAKTLLTQQSTALREEISSGGINDTTAAAYQGRSETLAAMSTADKRQLAKQFAGTEFGADISGLVGAESRFSKLSGKYGQTGAAARMLGVNMSRDELSKLDLKDKGADVLLARAGITDTDSVQALRGAAGKGGNALADALKGIMDKKAAEQDKQDKEKEEQKDELQKAMKANSDKANELLTKLVTYSGMTANEIKSQKDAEAKAGPAGGNS
jgi:hypothetical protein